MPQAEFAFNNSVNRTTGCTPFQIIYGYNLKTPLDISSLPMPLQVSEAALDFSKYMSTMHDDIRRKIAVQTEEYSNHANKTKNDKQYEVGEMD